MPNELRTIRELAAMEPCASLGVSYAWLYTLTATLGYIPHVFKDREYYATHEDVSAFISRQKIVIHDGSKTHTPTKEK